MEKKEIKIGYPTHTSTHPVWNQVETSIYDMKEEDVPSDVDVYRPWGNPSWYEEHPNYPYK